MIKQISFFLSLFCVAISVSATHLVGGTMSYKYVSSTADKITYEISLPIYRDCANSTVVFDPQIKIGVYNNKDKNKYAVKTLDLISKTILAPNCNSSFTSCIEVGTYTKTVTFDTSSLGYYITYMRCCRAKQNNIENNGNGDPENGFTFIAFIPPSKYKNNSPYFDFQPTLLQGINKTNEDNWGATDIDGDSLTYAIVAPYKGASLTLSEPDPPATLSNPVSIDYASGYSFTKPFGSSGSISIDPLNGKLTFSSSITGSFAFCVEIKEYRKGVMIGLCRRDYPLIFINTPQE